MLALGVLSTFITTISATFLMALKIILVTHQSRRQHQYSRIIEIIVQSAAIVSVGTLCLAILSLIDFISPFEPDTSLGEICHQLYAYLVFVELPIAVSCLCVYVYY